LAFFRSSLFVTHNLPIHYFSTRICKAAHLKKMSKKMNLKERTQIADALHEAMKACLVCAEGNMDCRPICQEHADMCETCIRLIMRDSPNWHKILKQCNEVAKMCVDACAKHQAESCKHCVSVCGKVLETVAPVCQ